MRHKWSGLRVLISGGTGFLGQHLVRRLLALEADITVLVRDQSRLDDASGKGVEFCNADVRNYNQVQRAIAATQPQIIFHLAAVGANKPFMDEELVLRVNLHGTLNILRAVRCLDLKKLDRIITLGTSYEYGESGELDPRNVYAASKVAAWAFCRTYQCAYDLPIVVPRLFNVYGPGQNGRALIPSAIRAALADQDFPMTPGAQRRDFIYVDDVIEGLLAVAATNGTKGRRIDLGTGISTPVHQVVERIYELVNSAGQPLIGALPYRPGAVRELVAQADQTAALIEWQAKCELEKGLQLTIEALSKT